MDEKSLASNIKLLRKQQKLTLQELADRTGLTKGYLSKVERSTKAPPYATLNRIAGALGVELTTVLKRDTEPLQDTTIAFGRRRDDQLIRETDEMTGYDYILLGANKPGKNMEPSLIYAPFEMARMYEHEGEEFFYVMEGRLEFLYGDRTYMMEAGDHVYYDSRVPHSGRSVGDRKAKLLVVTYFYKRNRQ